MQRLVVGFIKSLKQLSFSFPPLKAHSSRDVHAMRGELAHEAQKEYDDWDENEDEYAGGGICHLIAERMANHLSSKGIEAHTVSQQVGDQHVNVLAKLRDGVHTVDIHPHHYESGAGYSWKKKQGVKFRPDHVDIDKIDDNPENFHKYTEDY